MSRRGGGYSKFKVIEHRVTKRTAEIKVDKRHGDFYCEIGDAKKESKNLLEVEAWATDILSKSEIVLLDWVPVIDANVQDDHRGFYRNDSANDLRSVGVKVKAERYFIARSSQDADKREVWRKLSWQQCSEESPDRLPEDQFWAMSTMFREPSDAKWHGETPARLKGWVRLPETSSGHYLIAYDAELWAGIQHVIDVIENESKVLDKLFSTKEGRVTLAQVGSKPELLRLTAGGKSKR